MVIVPIFSPDLPFRDLTVPLLRSKGPERCRVMCQSQNAFPLSENCSNEEWRIARSSEVQMAVCGVRRYCLRVAAGAALAFALLIEARDVSAQQTSGRADYTRNVQSMLWACQAYARPSGSPSQVETDRIYACLYYTTGLADGITLGQALAQGSPKICFPRESSTGQKAAVFVRWAEAHPEKWAEHPVEGMISAFMEQWRCPS